MRYSPMSDIIVDLGMFERNEVVLNKLTWLMERCKAFLTRCDCFWRIIERRHGRVTVNKLHTEATITISLYKREKEQISGR